MFFQVLESSRSLENTLKKKFNALKKQVNQEYIKENTNLSARPNYEDAPEWVKTLYHQLKKEAESAKSTAEKNLHKLKQQQVMAEVEANIHGLNSRITSSVNDLTSHSSMRNMWHEEDHEANESFDSILSYDPSSITTDADYEAPIKKARTSKSHSYKNDNQDEGMIFEKVLSKRVDAADAEAERDYQSKMQEAKLAHDFETNKAQHAHDLDTQKAQHAHEEAMARIEVEKQQQANQAMMFQMFSRFLPKSNDVSDKNDI